MLILPPVSLSNLGSDLSINNIDQLGSADNTKIVSQESIKNVLELTENWNYSNFNRGQFFLEICQKHDTSLQSIGIVSAFYSTLLSFFVHFLSDVLVPFQDSSNLYSHVLLETYTFYDKIQ